MISSRMNGTKICCVLCPATAPLPTAVFGDHVGAHHTRYLPFKCAHCPEKGTLLAILQNHLARAHPGMEQKVRLSAPLLSWPVIGSSLAIGGGGWGCRCCF